MVVAAYMEELTRNLAPAIVKQHLAAIRMLFDWLVVNQVIPFNPACSVRGPKRVGKRGARRRCLPRTRRGDSSTGSASRRSLSCGTER